MAAERQRFVSILCRYPELFFEKSIINEEEEESTIANQRKCKSLIPNSILLRDSTMGKRSNAEERGVRRKGE
jgi:hypothetical protein